MEQESSFSWIHGVSFCFSVGRHNVEAWYSSISGSERLSVDSKVVYSQRSFLTNSSNTFHLDGVEYAVRLRVGSSFKGLYVFEVLKEGDVCQRQKVSFNFGGRWRRLGIMFLLVIIGAVIESVFLLPVLSNHLVIAMIIAAVVTYDLKKNPPTIEYSSV